MRQLCVLPLALTLIGCGGDDMPRSSGGTSGPRDQIECTASVAPTVLDYEVDADTLTLRSGFDQLSADRVDDGDAVFGIWDLGTDIAGGPFNLRVTGNLHIETDRVTMSALCQSTIGSTTAIATSLAIIDDTTIEILESDTDVKRIVR